MLMWHRNSTGMDSKTSFVL